MTADRNTVWARAFVDELARSGVQEACVAPGSRSTPLVLALAREDRIRCFVHLDERSAAFFALGVGKATGRPAAVVTTSGTATANLHPAVMEASESCAPLLVLTADRPARLRGTDANQTVDQLGLYGRHVRLFHEVGPPAVEAGSLRYLRGLAGRAVLSARGPAAGPVHLDFPFEKPLQPSPTDLPGAGDVPVGFREEAPLAASGRPGERPFTRAEAGRPVPGEETLARLSGLLSGTARGLVVCGPGAPGAEPGAAAVELARAAGWPLLADPLSGARFADGAAEWAMGAYDLFLRSEEVRERLAPELILRLGRSPTSAVLEGWLEERTEAEQVVVDAGPAWADHLAVATEYLRADPAATARRLAGSLAGTGAGDPGAWLEAWREVERGARGALEGELGGEFFEGEVLARAARAAPAGAAFFVGSSMPVRDLDAFAAPRDEPLLVLGNRGASGIDGGVSAALGAAAVTDGPTLAVLGDLALYHDMNGLLAAGKHGLGVLFVVIHNDGGGIFEMLPVREHEPAFTPFFATPHGLDFRHAAEMYGLEHRRVEGPGEDPEALEAALEEGLEAASRGETTLLVVASDRAANRRRRVEVREAVARALEEG